jgi:hypothetical protein
MKYKILQDCNVKKIQKSTCIGKSRIHNIDKSCNQAAKKETEMNRLSHKEYEAIKNDTLTVAVYDGLVKIKTVADLNYARAMELILSETDTTKSRSVRVYRDGTVDACMALMFGK